MQDHDLVSLSRYANQEAIGPGAVYYLPVQYNLRMPTPFLVRNDHTRQLEATSQAKVKLGNEWLDESTGCYRRGEKEKEILLQAKPRPFLILRRFKLKRVWRYGPYVIGLPITGIKDKMLDSPKMMENLQNAIYKEIHYLPLCRNKISGLDKPSVVVIATPMYIPTDYFTHFMGFINFQDLSIVVNKLGDFITGNGDYSKIDPL